jgi:DNA polymerase II small subunit/DNA polymerase delta subunit B
MAPAMKGIGMDWMNWVQLVELPVIGALFLWVRSETEKLANARSEADKALHERIDGVVKDQNDYQVKSAEQFVTKSELATVVQGWREDMRHVMDKLDRLIERGVGR